MKAQHEGTLTSPCIVWKNPQIPLTAPNVDCHLVNNSSQLKLHSFTQDEALLSCPNSSGTLRSESEMERNPEVPASNQDEALFHFVKPSGVPRDPSNSSVSLTTQRHLESSLRSPVEVEGNECFPPQPKKNLESPS